jgi:hypothetical protein
MVGGWDISGEAHLYVVLMTSTPKGGSQDASTNNETSKQQSTHTSFPHDSNQF